MSLHENFPQVQIGNNSSPITWSRCCPGATLNIAVNLSILNGITDWFLVFDRRDILKACVATFRIVPASSLALTRVVVSLLFLGRFFLCEVLPLYGNGFSASLYKKQLSSVGGLCVPILISTDYCTEIVDLQFCHTRKGVGSSCCGSHAHAHAHRFESGRLHIMDDCVTASTRTSVPRDSCNFAEDLGQIFYHDIGMKLFLVRQ